MASISLKKNSSACVLVELPYSFFPFSHFNLQSVIRGFVFWDWWHDSFLKLFFFPFTMLSLNYFVPSGKKETNKQQTSVFSFFFLFLLIANCNNLKAKSFSFVLSCLDASVGQPNISKIIPIISFQVSQIFLLWMK